MGIGGRGRGTDGKGSSKSEGDAAYRRKGIECVNQNVLTCDAISRRDFWECCAGVGLYSHIVQLPCPKVCQLLPVVTSVIHHDHRPHPIQCAIHIPLHPVTMVTASVPCHVQSVIGHSGHCQIHRRLDWSGCNGHHGKCM